MHVHILDSHLISILSQNKHVYTNDKPTDINLYIEAWKIDIDAFNHLDETASFVPVEQNVKMSWVIQ